MKKNNLIAALLFSALTVPASASNFDSSLFVKAFDLNQTGRLEVDEVKNAYLFSSMAETYKECSKELPNNRVQQCMWIYVMHSKQVPKTITEKMNMMQFCGKNIASTSIDSEGVAVMHNLLIKCTDPKVN